MTRDDLPGGVRRRRAAHARAGGADGPRARVGRAALLDDPASAILDIDRTVAETLRGARFPDGAVRPSARRQPAALDRRGSRQRPEHAKSGRAQAETNKILGRSDGADSGGRHLRPHRRDALPQPGADHQADGATCRSREIESMLPSAHEWVRVVPNEKEASLRELTPAAVTGHAAGADRPAAQARDGRRSISAAFTVGDQLLWAPPSRCAACCASCRARTSRPRRRRPPSLITELGFTNLPIYHQLTN